MSSIHKFALAFALSVSVYIGAAPVLAETPPSTWGPGVGRQDAAWYATAEARRIADNAILYQSAEGGFPKNTNMMVPPVGPLDEHTTNTFDNYGTTLPVELLARVISAGGDTPARHAAFSRGLTYILSAQYPNGGWPQFFPLRGGYYDHVTFNDDAMVHILNLLTQVAGGLGPYEFVAADVRAQAADAVARGTDVILRTQIVQDGKLTVWCAQHDEVTLAPAWARAFEPPSLSGYESVGITRYLMAIPNPSQEVIAAVEGSIEWLRDNAIPDISVERFTDASGAADRRIVAAPGARLWARFYKLETNTPIFLGRASAFLATLAEVEQERRGGYSYYDGSAAFLIDRDYPAWRARNHRS